MTGQSGAQGTTPTLPGQSGTQGTPTLPGQSGTQDGAATGGMGGGGPFGSTQSLTQVLAYTQANGGGNVGVSSQMSASSAVLGGANEVVAIGGFSGRESEVSVTWLAQAIRNGQIRWVLTDGSGGGQQDGRVGSSAVMAAVEQTCKLVPSSSYSTSTSTTSGGGALYDCQGFADALQVAA